MQQTVVGVFDSMSEAQGAVSALAAEGLSRDRVQISDAPASGGLGTTTHAHADADDGVLSGIKHFFSGLFGDDDDHEHASYAEAVRRGGAIVKVTVADDAELERVTTALDDAGAVDIEERADSWRAEGWTGAQRSSTSSATAGMAAGAAGLAASTGAVTPASSAGVRADTESGTIPVIREQLEVGKRTVGTGGVRVYARTVSEPVNESVELRSERAQVERRPVDRPASEADLAALEDRTIEVRETAEKAVVAKTARVVEEVSVGKTVESRTEKISDSVRHTEVEVERLAGGADTDAMSSGWRSDFQTRYGAQGGSYDEYEPAYRFGHGLRSDQRFSGRQWDEIEPDVRRDWESRNPGSAWERFKDAVRHAWDRAVD